MRVSQARPILLSLCFWLCGSAAAYDGDPITNAVRDIGYLQGAPSRMDDKPEVYLAGGLLVMGAVIYSLDGQIRHIAHKNKNSFMAHTSRQAEKIGNSGYGLALLGGLAGAGWIIKDSKLTDTSIMALESFLAANAVGTVLKYSVGRARPYAGDGKRAFRPFSFKSSHTSFPSGHTTSAFAMASVFAARYEPVWVRAALYGGASIAALQRVYSEKHWASDVFSGAVLGTVTGYAVVRLSAGRAAKSARVIPVYGSGYTGVLASVPF